MNKGKSYSLPQNFSDEEMARDWTLLEKDKQEIGKYRRVYRLFIAVQLCAIKLYGRFLNKVNDLSPRIINYLNVQIGLEPSLIIQVPTREATYLEQRMNKFLNPFTEGFQLKSKRELISFFLCQKANSILILISSKSTLLRLK